MGSCGRPAAPSDWEAGPLELLTQSASTAGQAKLAYETAEAGRYRGERLGTDRAEVCRGT
jgi:hypothetical protein